MGVCLPPSKPSEKYLIGKREAYVASSIVGMLYSAVWALAAGRAFSETALCVCLVFEFQFPLSQYAT